MTNDTDTAHYKLLNNRVINKTTCYYPIIIRPTASERLANGTSEQGMGRWVMGQMGHENRMGHMGHGSLGVDP